jgi:hypothetical protein
MEITKNSNLNIIPKQVIITNNNSNPLKVSVSSLTADSFSFSKTATAKGPTSENVSEKLTGFGNKYFNQPVFDHFLAYRNDPKYMPVITKIDQAISQGVSIKEIEKVAINATKETYKNLKPNEIASIAYRSINASTMKNKYSDPNFFNGEKDKIFHYFVSGSLTIDAYNNIPLLPHDAKVLIARKTILAIGWLKEVGSIPGNGFGADDMIANRMGTLNAIQHLK